MSTQPGGTGPTRGFSRRRFVFGAAACAACAVTGVSALSLSPGGGGASSTADHTDTRVKRRHVQPNGLFDVRTSQRIVGLSFDDGPDPAYTPEVLDILRYYGARATFFVVGVNALAHPDLIADQRSAGHTFGNHTFDHLDLDRLDATGVAGELDRGRQALLEAGTPSTNLFRPPKGYTDHDVRVAADGGGYTTVFWDTCVERFVNHTTISEGVRKTLAGVRPGAIVLAHDGGTIAGTGRPPLDRSRTVRALPVLLERLRAEGYEVVDIPTLLAHRSRSTHTPVTVPA